MDNSFTIELLCDYNEETFKFFRSLSIQSQIKQDMNEYAMFATWLVGSNINCILT